MKQIILISITTSWLAMNASAQTTANPRQVVKKEASQPLQTIPVKPVKTTSMPIQATPQQPATTSGNPPQTPPPPPPPPPPASTPATPTLSPAEKELLQSWPHYYLEAAKVIIYTGNDAKEKPSSVLVNIQRKGGYYNDEADKWIELYNNNPNNSTSMEFKTNSPTEFNLNHNYKKPSQPSSGYNPEGSGYKWPALSLKKIEEYGLQLQISYAPNFFTDAWKVEKVVLVLQFKDILGRPHPTLGNKEITFFKSKLLTGSDGRLTLETDGFLFPKL